MAELAQSRYFGHIVRTGDERYPKITWQTRTQRKTPRGRPQDTWGKSYTEYEYSEGKWN